MEDGRPPLKVWCVSMSIEYKARGLEGSVGAIEVAHTLAEAFEDLGQDIKVYLGEDYEEVDDAGSSHSEGDSEGEKA